MPWGERENWWQCLHSGGGCRNPAGSRRTVGQHENPGSESQPQTPSLCEQPHSEEEEITRVTDYSVDSPLWLVWLSAGFWKVSQGFALLLPLMRVERISPLNSIRSWRHSVVNYLSEKCAALCLELTKPRELVFGISSCYSLSSKLLKHQAKGRCLYPRPWERSRGFKRCLGKAPRRDCSVYSPPGW